MTKAAHSSLENPGSLPSSKQTEKVAAGVPGAVGGAGPAGVSGEAPMKGAAPGCWKRASPQRDPSRRRRL